MLDKLESTKDKVEEEESDGIEHKLNDKIPEGHVNVDDVALFSVF